MMSKKYEQFLGSNPGLVVDLIDSGNSPYSLKTVDGFEFVVSSDDFNNFYRLLGDGPPSRWKNLVTDASTGMVDTTVVGPLITMIRNFQSAFADYPKARSFLRWCMGELGKDDKSFLVTTRKKLEEDARHPDFVSDEDLKKLVRLDQLQKNLLADNSFGEIIWPVGRSSDSSPFALSPGQDIQKEKDPEKPKKKVAKQPIPRMKNVELEIGQDLLTIHIDLSKEFGPSKSGRNNIVATTEGNKTLPGRDERIGMTIYREITPKTLKKGAKDSFKNVRMNVDGDILTVVIDLTKEIGPSKSGKTVIIASTGGNQYVFKRSEKIGLNVYRPI